MRAREKQEKVLSNRAISNNFFWNPISQANTDWNTTQNYHEQIFQLFFQIIVKLVLIRAVYSYLAYDLSFPPLL